MVSDNKILYHWNKSPTFPSFDSWCDDSVLTVMPPRGAALCGFMVCGVAEAMDMKDISAMFGGVL